MMEAEILLIDDDAQFRQEMQLALGEGFHVHEAASGREACKRLDEIAPDVVLLDIQLGEEDGRDLLRELQARAPELPVLMLSVMEEVSVVVECMQAGAWHYLSKAAPIDLVRETVRRAVLHGQAEKQCRYFRGRLDEEHGGEEVEAALVAESPVMQRLLREIRQVASTNVEVLITGETGTGKDLVARAIHRQSARRAGPFMPVDLLGVPGQLVYGHLFGHERGAFTDAKSRRIGALEAAQGGTLLIDEIGDLPADVQAKLLRFLQERTFQRLGSSAWVRADARILTATNQPLERLVAEGSFRQDLYHRIHVYEIRVPPLRERGADIPGLTWHFLSKHRPTVGRSVRDVDPRVFDQLQQRPWKGNVRELEHVVLSAMVRCAGERLTLADFAAPGPTPASVSAAVPYTVARETALEEFKRAYLGEALAATGGVVNEAARRAGLAPSSFRRMLREVGMR